MYKLKRLSVLTSRNQLAGFASQLICIYFDINQYYKDSICVNYNLSYIKLNVIRNINEIIKYDFNEINSFDEINLKYRNDVSTDEETEDEETEDEETDDEETEDEETDEETEDEETEEETEDEETEDEDYYENNKTDDIKYYNDEDDENDE